MGEIKDLWKSEQALEVFLCLVDEMPKSQEEISQETGYSQGRISELLHKLENKKLVYSPEYRKESDQWDRPRQIWATNAEPIFSRIIFFKNPHFSRNSTVDRQEYQELPKLMFNYLRIVARSQQWRSQRWLENNFDKLYSTKSKRKKRSLLNLHKLTRHSREPNKINLEKLSEQFIEYLLVNRKEPKFTKRQEKEMMQLIESYHLSNDSRHLRDVYLSKRKGRLIIDKK